LVTESLERFDASTAVNAIETFVTDLSQWYLRRSRERVGPAATDKVSKEGFYCTMYDVLVTLCRLLAPFVPFLSEEMYTNLTGEQSVHLSGWVVADKTYISDAMEEQMALARQVVELAHAKRKEQKLKVRQPLATLHIVSPIVLSENILGLVRDEVNVKNVLCKKGPQLTIDIDVNITEELRAEGEARELAHKIQMLRKEKGCTINEQIGITLPKEYKDIPERLLSYVQTKTLAKTITWGETLQISTG